MFQLIERMVNYSHSRRIVAYGWWTGFASSPNRTIYLAEQSSPFFPGHEDALLKFQSA